jgi:hypothetical protein
VYIFVDIVLMTSGAAVVTGIMVASVITERIALEI